MFLRNSWYVAAWASEVTRMPRARTLLGEPVVFYRDEAAIPVALEDRCCHRSLPLSLGRTVADGLQCGYHGLVFDRTGAVVRVPGQTSVPPGARVRAYPLVERWRLIWIWMGPPERADPGLIPDWFWTDHPDWALVPGNGAEPLHVRCNYELVTDNLLDLTHLTYVHGGSIGNEALVDFPMQLDRLADGVRTMRWILDRPPPPFHKRAGNFAGNVDRRMVTTSIAPGFSVNEASSFEAGQGAELGKKVRGISVQVMNAPTPETERSTHYFYAHARNFALGDAAMDQAFRTNYSGVFHEDRVILEAQQRALERPTDTPEIDINGDAAALAMRRIHRGRVAKESPAAMPSRGEAP